MPNLIIRISGYCLFATLLLSALAQAESNCHPLSVKTCGLPFPSNFYSVADADSPTGLRLSMSDSVLREDILAELPDRLRITTVLGGLTGYSALTPVLFEMPRAIDIKSLPKNGGKTLKVFDLESGELMALDTGLNYPARAPKVSSPATVIEAYPRARWKFGRTYVAVLTNYLKDSQGDSFAAVAGMTEASAADDSALSNYYEPLLTFLETQGIDRNDILSLTSFTVRDEPSVTGRLLEMVDTINAQDHPINITGKLFIPFGSIAARIVGQIRLSDFRADDGGIQYQSGDEGEPFWVSFNLTIPRNALDGSVPLMLYGHGIAVTKETAIIIENQNADNGVATLTIDHPNHGSRIDTEGYMMSHFKPQDILHITGMVTQSTLDFHAVLAAVKQHLGDLDLLPGGSIFFTNADHPGGLNTPDLDLENITYGGTSLGGLFGTSFAATAPDLKGVFLQIAGAGVGNTLSHTGFFSVLGMDGMFPKEATGGEVSLLLNIAVHLVDYADGLNFAHYFRNPPVETGLAPRPLTLQFGYRDQIVVNAASVALAETSELDVIMKGQHGLTLKFLDYTPDEYDGYGVYQSTALINRFLDLNAFPLTDVLSHLTFFDTTTTLALKDFTDTVIFQREKEPNIIPVDDSETVEDEVNKPTPIVTDNVDDCATCNPEPLLATPETSKPVVTPQPVAADKPQASPSAEPKPLAVNHSNHGGALNLYWLCFVSILLFARRSVFQRQIL